MGPKVEGAIEPVAEREGAGVRDCDGNRDRKAEAVAQTREDSEIGAEGETVDQAKAKKCRCNDRTEPERKPADDRPTHLVESLDQA